MVFWLFWPMGLALLFLLTVVALPVVLIAYTAYRARVARERQAVVRPYAGPDPLDELRRVNDALEGEARAAREAAEGAREAVRHGVRG